MMYVSQLEFSKNYINNFIQHFEKNQSSIKEWDQTFLIRLKSNFDLNTDSFFYNQIVNLVYKVQSFVIHDSNFKYFENIEIVKYPTGSSKGFHFDTSVKERTAASITYINDDYIGGQTVADGVSVHPIAGRTFYFYGKNYKHNVMNVIKGTRYTLSIWYGKNERSVLYEGF